MAKKKTPLDFFTFFLISMALLTLLMVGLCIFTKYRLSKKATELNHHNYNTTEIRQKLTDPKFRNLLAEKTTNLRRGSNNQMQVKQLINRIVNKEGTLRNIAYSARDSKQNMKKETYNVRLRDLTIRGLVNCLYFLERLQATKIENLNLEKTQKPFRPWEANFTISIFSPSTSKRRR